MPVKKSDSQLPPLYRRSVSEGHQAPADQSASAQQAVADQGAEQRNTGLAMQRMSRRHSLQELQLRQAIEHLHAPRGESHSEGDLRVADAQELHEGSDDASVSTAELAEFLTEVIGDTSESPDVLSISSFRPEPHMSVGHQAREEFQAAAMASRQISRSERLGEDDRSAGGRRDGQPLHEGSDTSTSFSHRLDASLSREELVAQWNTWAASATSVSQNRGIAVQRLIRCLDDGSGLLRLNGLGLASLPEHFPPTVVDLDVSGNWLTMVPGGLPAGLRSLDLSGNQLTSLPDDLPAGLHDLVVSENHLSQLPRTLPTALTELVANGNELTELPENLPIGLTRLDVSENRLTQVPESLPDTLQVANFALNRLSALPANLPDALTELDVARNDLTALPEHVPQDLEYLGFENNRLTRVPENILSLFNGTCEVHLSGNPLSDRARNRLHELTSAQDYEGPYIGFSMPGSAYARPPARPLQEAVAEWPGAQLQETQQTWSSFAGEEGAADFSQFLDYLRETVNFQNPAFQRGVAEWLTHLQERPELRRDTFLISQGASERCEDRVSLAFNAMRQARLTFDVQRGDYDDRLPELMTLGRGMFRLDQLEVIAKEKVQSLNFVDDVEVYLAYQVKLRGPLELPLDTPDMRYFNVSYVTQADLDRAQERVKATEREGFSDFLSCDWQPWQAVMQRIDPKGHDRTQEALIDAMGDEFSSRLQARLEQEGLRGNPDAERELGAQVKNEISREIHGRRTQDFLLSRGLLEQLRN